MDPGTTAHALIDTEARGLLTRLDMVRPFVLNETMVVAACLPYDALVAIERFLHQERKRLRNKVKDFLSWLHREGRTASAAEQQRRFVILRLGFNNVLAQFDLFTEVVTQRSETQTGVWLSGLDVLAADALRVDVAGRPDPSAVCYLARGAGAAIRRTRTRLPGGALNPVAVIRVPRERMIGSGIASSLIHEVGHQGVAQLGLVESLRRDLTEAAKRDAKGGWDVWYRWISEIVADCWSVGTIGITSTVGLLAVVSLPSFFVFRPSGNDPHPMPYLRVLVSTSIGQALYPHPQWAAMRNTWKSLYPIAAVPQEIRAAVERCEATIGPFVELLLNHRSDSLGDRALGEIWPTSHRQPAQLLLLHKQWNGDFGVMARQRPSLVFAVIGQAKASGLLSAERESALLQDLLSAWAVRSSLDVTTTYRPLASGSRRAS
ncbi:hypothetical protein [Prescottella agglutinans]|uniref:hypothetical protein n=1 Tax=Prescottella agglutinans TaxID=1644129 RepID=UPI003D9979E8